MTHRIRVAVFAASCLIVIPSAIYADQKQSEENATVRFIVSEPPFILTVPARGTVVTSKADFEKTAEASVPPIEIIKSGETKSYEVMVKDIASIVKTIRKVTCDAIENGTFKVSIGVDASGKIMGIGIQGNTGFEITVNCEKKQRVGNS